MVGRVSTYTTSNSIFSQTQRLQVGYANASMQTSSGLRADGFEGIAPDAQRLLAFQSDLNVLTSQSTAIKSANLRVNEMYNVCNTISSTLDRVTQLFANVMSGIDVSGGAAANVAQATSIRDELVNLLNSKLGPDYLFSGSAYDRKPVDINDAAYTPAAAPTTPDTDYYQSNGTLDSVRVSSSLRVTYGVTADNAAFEKALRALNIFIANPTSPTIISQAFELNKQAIDGVANIRGELGAKAKLLEDEQARQDASIEYMNETIAGLRDADVADATVRMSQIQAQLQASFGSLSQLLKLRLSDYFR